MLPDPLGYKRYCFTPIVSYIADTPEAAMLATVGGKTSPLTMAMYKQFRDPFRHEPCTASTTLAQLAVVKSKVDPSDIKAYLCEAQQFRLNGVHEPFWRNAALCCPSIFLTPEILHYLHKFFWDHDVKWCLQIVGDAEIDFRLSVLQPTAGFRHFKGGISKLKQVTGRVHCDVQHYIVGIIAGAAPCEILCAICALMDFRYQVQSYLIDNDDLQQISAALDEFHRHKQAVLNFGARWGKGSRIIDNWYIPKLELMQSFVPSIRNVGVAIQWTTDVTEHAHVTEIKTPAEASNNHNYDPQICWYLDRSEKCRMFELTMSLTESNAASHGIMQGGLTAEESDLDGDEDTTCIKGLGSHDLSLITSLSLLLSHPKAQDPFPFPFGALQQMELRSISHTTHPYDVPTSMMLQRNSASLTFMLPLHTTFTVSKLMVQVTLILSVAAIAEQAILLCHLQKSRFGLKYAYRTQQYTMRQKYSQHRLFIAPLPATPGHLVVMTQLFSTLIIVLHGRRMA